MSKAKALAGAGLKLYINNRLFAIATGFEWRSEGGRRAIYGLDQVNPIELAPSVSTVTGTVECLRIKLDGGLEGRGIVTSDANMLLEKYISIVLIDRLNDTVVFRCENAAVNTQQWKVNSKGLLAGSFTFQGITWDNESET